MDLALRYCIGGTGREQPRITKVRLVREHVHVRPPGDFTKARSGGRTPCPPSTPEPTYHRRLATPMKL